MPRCPGGVAVLCPVFFAFAEATTKERLAQGDTIVMHAERSTDGDDPVARSLVERMFSVCSRKYFLCQSLSSHFVQRGSFYSKISHEIPNS